MCDRDVAYDTQFMVCVTFGQFGYSHTHTYFCKRCIIYIIIRTIYLTHVDLYILNIIVCGTIFLWLPKPAAYLSNEPETQNIIRTLYPVQNRLDTIKSSTLLQHFAKVFYLLGS